MPSKPLIGFSSQSLTRFRKTKPKTRAQKKSKTQAQIREEKEKNLKKARKKLAANRKAAKK